MFFHEYEPQENFAAVNKAGADTIEFWMETPTFWLRGAHASEVADMMRIYPNLWEPSQCHAPRFRTESLLVPIRSVADLTA